MKRAGGALIELMIALPRSEGRQKAKLNANQASLVAYYAKYGFAADTPGGLNMTLTLQ